MLVFEERGNHSTRRKPLGEEQRTNKLNQHMTPDRGIEPGPQCQEASALTTVPSLHPANALLIGKTTKKLESLIKNNHISIKFVCF